MHSLIPDRPWARRLMYELVYAWPTHRRLTTFNVGFAPVDSDIRADLALGPDPRQIQLYAELFELVALSSERWRCGRFLEIAAGCGGGLSYLVKRCAPTEAVGIDVSAMAVRKGRRRGLTMQVADAAALPFEGDRFDGVICVDAAAYLPVPAFAREVGRVLKVGGTFLLAESFTNVDAAHEALGRIAILGGLKVERFRDVSEAVRRSIRERAPAIEAQIRWLPEFFRSRLRETLVLETSERYRQWQSGALCFVLAVLSKKASLRKTDGGAPVNESPTRAAPEPALIVP